MDLTDAFALVPGDCVAIAGGGGKTTIMYRLVREAASRGRTAVAGGTTRFTPPRYGAAPRIVVVSPDEDPTSALRAALADEPAVICTTGRGDKGRWLPLSCKQVEEVVRAGVAGLVVFEADGSRNRPFKAPGEHEPVIPAVATVVPAVVGLDVLGRPLANEWVHRPEQVARLARVARGAIVTPEVVAAVLLHPEGGRKGVPRGARWIVVLNKAEPARRDAGDMLARLLLSGGAERVVLTAAEADEPVVAVYEGGSRSYA